MTKRLSSPLIAANTHPKEYLLHKYWSRKPSNIVSHFLSQHAGCGRVLLDPFCGSGVSLLEAKRLGLTAFGFDVNPIAATLSSVTINPPSTEEFIQALAPLLKRFESLCRAAYASGNSCIRYNVHETIVKCPACANEVALGDAVREGRLYKCPSCTHKLHFNLQSLIRTRVVRSIFETDGHAQDNTAEEQTRNSNKPACPVLEQYDRLFAENRRILAFEGMTTRVLFTPRNFSLLAWFADQCHMIKQTSVRDAACLLLTASVAQCSRLIPYRNNMTTGGPAWSVPGFWVPPVHLETNPIFHFMARYQKFQRGLAALHKNQGHGDVNVECTTFSKGIDSLREKNIHPDIVFFDPPYGDSVPFAEFSQLWNSFLKDMPKVEEDLSVSDRLPKDEAWSKYENGLERCLRDIANIISPDGVVIVTFNNSDSRAWAALISAFQHNHFYCEYVGYQIPAVISAKAQFSVEGSYVSDIYSVWKPSKQKDEYNRTLAPVVEALERCAASRDGVITRSLGNRAFMLAILENNRSYECLKEQESILQSIFEESGTDLRLRQQFRDAVPAFRQIARTAAISLLRKGAASWQRVYEAVARAAYSEHVGIPDPGEVREALEGIVLANKDRCHLLQEKEESQLALFV